MTALQCLQRVATAVLLSALLSRRSRRRAESKRANALTKKNKVLELNKLINPRKYSCICVVIICWYKIAFQKSEIQMGLLSENLKNNTENQF